jgi:Fe-S-cluster-containing dehydrogenase component
VTFAVDRVDAKPCYGCRRFLDIVAFPYARPRADGTRHRMRFCEDCLSQRQDAPEEQKRAVRKLASRESRVRRLQRARAA